MRAVPGYRPYELEREAARVDRTPTDGQKEAGNYKKGHLNVHGLDISIETPHGGQRNGVKDDGTPWSVTMPFSYGYIRRTTGADGEQVDVIVGPDPESDKAFVVDQVRLDGTWDEHKCFLAFEHPSEVALAYDAMFSDGSGPQRRREIHPMSIAEFKDWLRNQDTTQPLAKQALAIADRLLKMDPTEARDYRGRWATSGGQIMRGASGRDVAPKPRLFNAVYGTRHPVKAAQYARIANERGGAINIYDLPKDAKFLDMKRRGLRANALLERSMPDEQKNFYSEVYGDDWRQNPKAMEDIALERHMAPTDAFKKLVSRAGFKGTVFGNEVAVHVPELLRFARLLKGFDPSEARGAHGEWTSGGAAAEDSGAGSASLNHSGVKTAARAVSDTLGDLVGDATAPVVTAILPHFGVPADAVNRGAAEIISQGVQFAIRILAKSDSDGLRKFDPSEARDNRGEWTSGGAAPDSSKASVSPLDAARSTVAPVASEVGPELVGKIVGSDIVGASLKSALVQFGVPKGAAQAASGLAATYVNHGLQMAVKLLTLIKFDQSEARDEKGQWTSGGETPDKVAAGARNLLLAGALAVAGLKLHSASIEARIPKLFAEGAKFDRKAIRHVLNTMSRVADRERLIVVRPRGIVHDAIGTKNSVQWNPTPEQERRGTIIIHNHPARGVQGGVSVPPSPQDLLTSQGFKGSHGIVYGQSGSVYHFSVVPHPAPNFRSAQIEAAGTVTRLLSHGRFDVYASGNDPASKMARLRRIVSEVTHGKYGAHQLAIQHGSLLALRDAGAIKYNWRWSPKDKAAIKDFKPQIMMAYETAMHVLSEAPPAVRDYSTRLFQKLAKFDESEARDESGRWTVGGAASSIAPGAEKAMLAGAAALTVVGGVGAMAPHTKSMVTASRRAITGNAQKAWSYFKRGGRLIRGETTGTPASAPHLSGAERKALKDYISNSIHVNNILREDGGLESVLKVTAEKVKAAGLSTIQHEGIIDRYKRANDSIKHIDAAISRAQHHDPMIVLRGITGGRRDLAVGNVLHDPGFTSTTTKHATASTFAHTHYAENTNGLLAVIHVPNGIGALDLDKAGVSTLSENEILLERGLRYVVDEVIGHTVFLHADRLLKPELGRALIHFIKSDVVDELAKFIGAADDDVRRLLRKAAQDPSNVEQSLADRMASAFAWMGDTLSGAVSSAAGSVKSAVGALPMGAIEHRLHSALSVVDPVFMGAAEGVSSRRPKVVAVDFDQRNQQVQSFLDNYKMDLVQQITDSQQKTIHDIVTEGISAGLPPAQMAQRIRDGLGLTSYQAQNVINFRDELEHINEPGNAASALSRQLRDQRYDPSIKKAIESGTDLPTEHVDTMVDAYKRRYIAYRATTIARTEALRASNLGSVAAAQDLIDSGQVPDGYGIRKTWLATNDNRTRATHRALNGQSVIGMDTPFVSSSGAQLLYPHDPSAPASETVNCRCTTQIDVVPLDGGT